MPDRLPGRVWPAKRLLLAALVLVGIIMMSPSSIAATTVSTQPDDAADAVAVAVCHIHSARMTALINDAR